MNYYNQLINYIKKTTQIIKIYINKKNILNMKDLISTNFPKKI